MQRANVIRRPSCVYNNIGCTVCSGCKAWIAAASLSAAILRLFLCCRCAADEYRVGARCAPLSCFSSYCNVSLSANVIGVHPAGVGGCEGHIIAPRARLSLPPEKNGKLRQKHRNVRSCTCLFHKFSVGPQRTFDNSF